MMKKCLQLSFTALTLMVTLLFVSMSIAETDLPTDDPSHKSESTSVPRDSVLHLIPEKTLGLIYCPNLLDLDNRIRTLKTALLSEIQAPAETQTPDVSVEILSGIFGSQFEDLIALEEVFNVNRDFAIVLTRLKPLRFAVLAHLNDPEAIKEIIEKVAKTDERIKYKDVTYWNDNEDAESIAILGNIFVFSKHRAVCENIIDTYNGTMPAITQNPDYTSFLTDISEDTDQLGVYFGVKAAIDTFGGSLEEELESIIAQLEAEDDRQEFEIIGPFLKGLSGEKMTFIEQVQSVSLRFQIDGTDILLKPFLKFTNDSQFRDVLAEVSDELVFLDGLPNRSFMNAAFQGNSKFLPDLNKYWFDFFPKNTKEERAQRDANFEQMKDFYESLAARWSFSFNFKDTLSPDYLYIYELKDEQSAKTYMDEVLLEKLSYTGAYPGKSILHNRVEIKSYVFPNFEVELAKEPAEISNLESREWHWYYAFTDGQLIFTTGTSPAAIQVVLDRRAQIEPQFSDHPSYQKILKKLGTDNNILLVISPVTAAKTMLPRLAKEVEDDPDIGAPLQVFSALFTTLPENYSAGFSVKARDNGIDANLLLDLVDFKQLMQMLGMMDQMALMQ